jgi:outer membrane protein assembly factor BamB
MNARLILTAVLSTTTIHAAEWPQYRGPQGDGTSPEKIAAWPASGPRVLWKVESTNGFSSFAVSGGKACTIEGREAEGVRQEVLVARDAATGKELWTAPLGVARYDGGGDSGSRENSGGDGPRSTPAIAGKNVVTLSSGLVLQAFDLASGKEQWKIDLPKDHAGRNIQWQNAASPLLEGGLLYVAGGGPGQSLLVVDPATGQVLNKAFDEKITHATPTAATILGARQIIFFLQSGLLAVEPKTLAELWRYKFPYRVSTAASPVVSGDIVFCSAGYGVGAGAVSLTNASGKWEAKEIYRVPGDKQIANHWSTPVSFRGSLYGMFQFKQYGSGPVKAVEAETGAVKWEREGFGPGNVVLANDKILALSDAGELVVFQPKPDAYAEFARVKVLEGKCWTTPVIADGRIFARSTREAVCIDATGK